MGEEQNGELDINSVLSEDKGRIKAVFDEEYQFKFIKCFLEDNKFYEQLMDIIVPEYFDEYQRIYVNYIIKFINKYGIRPDYSDIKGLINKNEKQSVCEYLHGITEKVQNIQVKSVEAIHDTAYEFFKKRALALAIKKSVSSWAKNDFDSIQEPIIEALRSGEPKDTGHDYVDDIEETLKEEFRKPIACMPGLDEKIGGGVSRGEMAVVMAPTGGGKSMMLVAMAANAFAAGRKVLYYTLELSHRDVSKRFHAALNNVLLNEVLYQRDKIIQTAKEIKARGGALKIKKYESGTATVNTLKAHLATVKRNEGFVPDIVFIDYVDIMEPTEQGLEHRHMLQKLYRQVRGMSEEFEVPVWTATQTNRQATKEEKIGVDSIADSYAKAAELDLLISVARTEEQKNKNEAIVGVVKSRLGADGFFLEDVEFDTSRVGISFPKKGQNNFPPIPGVPPTISDENQNNFDAMEAMSAHAEKNRVG